MQALAAQLLLYINCEKIRQVAEVQADGLWCSAPFISPWSLHYYVLAFPDMATPTPAPKTPPPFPPSNNFFFKYNFRSPAVMWRIGSFVGWSVRAAVSIDPRSIVQMFMDVLGNAGEVHLSLQDSFRVALKLTCDVCNAQYVTRFAGGASTASASECWL